MRTKGNDRNWALVTFDDADSALAAVEDSKRRNWEQHHTPDTSPTDDPGSKPSLPRRPTHADAHPAGKQQLAFDVRIASQQAQEEKGPSSPNPFS